MRREFKKRDEFRDDRSFGRDRPFRRDRFEDRRGGRDERRSGRDGRDRLEMHSVICDECGVECEVPFKPTSSKPVYCSACFEKRDGSRGDFRDRSPKSNLDLSQINEKLDKIMKALKIE